MSWGVASKKVGLYFASKEGDLYSQHIVQSAQASGSSYVDGTPQSATKEDSPGRRFMSVIGGIVPDSLLPLSWIKLSLIKFCSSIGTFPFKVL